MSSVANTTARSKNKNKKERKERASEASFSVATSEFREDGFFLFRVLAGTPQRAGASGVPRIVIPAREHKRCGLASGDLALVQAENGGRRTVAACESGRHEGGALLSASVAQSLGVAVGDAILLTADFEALEAGEVRLEVPHELQNDWSGLVGSSLRLDLYLAAVFESTLLVSGDVRFVSVNGRACPLRILACKPIGQVDQEIVSDQLAWPCLVSKRTRLAIVASAHRPQGVVVVDEFGDKSAPELQERSGLARIGGLQAVVEELREAVQMPLEKPELYRKLGISPPRGVLLYGPPGTGKTLLAKSLAEEMRCPVEMIAATDLVGSGVGEAEERIKATFDRCRQLAVARGTGALLFIDEIDAVCPKRDDSSEIERRMVAAFLVALDGAKGSNDGVVVLGATNRPDSIDPALRRAGRLEREIEVGVPNAQDREHILDVHLASIRNSLTQDERKLLARRCHGYVGADLRAVCMSAARAALRLGRAQVDLDMCLEAVRLIPPSALKELLVEVPEVHWGDIGGYEATKEALREAVEWPIKYGWAFEGMGIDPPRGVLLYGPPGCSKTMMAKAVATETEMNFISIKGPELFSKYVGDSERSVREVFRKARCAAPCVIFFDEVDAVGASREGEGAGGVAARVLAQLLAEMDGIGAAGPSRPHLVILAATNRPHVLDPALTRPGRFDRLVHVPLPDAAARLAIFVRQLSRMRVDAAVDPSMLAERTEWCSGAECVMVCREAAMLAIRAALETVGRVDEEGASQASGPCAEVAHFEAALSAVRPRIDRDMVRFYEDFEQRVKLG